MSGKPQFDDNMVINAAMGVFWRRGFVASSMDELTTAMGLSRSSLYKRFRDKGGLYQEVLATYTDRVLRRMGDVHADSRRAQLEAMLLEFVREDVDTAKPAGCMLARACAEMMDLPESGQAVALEGLAGQRAILREILSAAAANGELRSTADIDALAWHFLGVLQAIRNLPQAGATAADLRKMIAAAMTAWPQEKG
ncbi:TetR/AcrR family transcriptional regulator [Sphingobium sp. AP49]|uniref:TetR/AcrR family transcriptional regulator n=1 Tax=Sphingobium sp. AP49 TaxID=1144307 RepID=UPI00026ECF07|nr:TetR/AcrR family transcriptional regulator [Sphingobium sp. AP49]WHO37760.1 TetR/AcrR family transcriptional regulator [Sphingobium sp. AP49]